MISRTNEYTPDYAILPGEHILELLDVHGMSQKELAERAGVTPKHINTVIKGNARITPEFAHSLGMIFNYPADMWLSFQNCYDLSVIDAKKEKEHEEQADFLSEFDYKDLANAGYVPRAETIAEKLNNLLRFFEVASTDACRKRWITEKTSLRLSGARTIKRGNIAAWLQYGQIFGKS